MKKLALSLLLCSVSVFAASVTYSTTGEFLASGTDISSSGDATITFSGMTNTTVSTPFLSSLGTFNVAASVGGVFSDVFVLTITQTAPSGGSATSATAVDGTITGTSSGITLTFVPSSVVIGSVTYVFSPDSFLLNSPGNTTIPGFSGLNNLDAEVGNTTIQAFITTIPEPASLGLLGGSLLGLGLLACRRAAKISESRTDKGRRS